MWWEIIYDVIYLFDVVAVLASTIVYDRGVQPAARGPNTIQQSGFLCRSLVLDTDSLCELWNEGAARGLICLIAFGPSVIKVAHPWYAICEMLVICIPTITEHLVVAVQPHHFNSQS